MTEITVVRGDDGIPVGFEARYHAGDSPAGDNLVCASITVLFELLSEVAEDLPRRGVNFEQNPDETYWSIQFRYEALDDRDRHLAKSLVENGLSTFKKIHSNHPEQCRFTDPDT